MAKLTAIGTGNAFNEDGLFHACYLIESLEISGLLDVGASSPAGLMSLGEFVILISLCAHISMEIIWVEFHFFY